jgi:hypothetical protein
LTKSEVFLVFKPFPASNLLSCSSDQHILVQPTDRQPCVIIGGLSDSPFNTVDWILMEPIR